MDRNEISDQYKWDLTQIFTSLEEFNKTYDEVKAQIKNFAQYETAMDNDATNFYNTLNDYYQISRQLDKLYVYTSMNFDIDTSNNDSQSLKIRVTNLYDEWAKVSFFVTPTILKKDYHQMEEYYKEEPKLLEYETILKREFRYKDHVLSAKEEKLLSSI